MNTHKTIYFDFSNWKMCSFGFSSGEWGGYWRISHFPSQLKPLRWEAKRLQVQSSRFNDLWITMTWINEDLHRYIYNIPLLCLDEILVLQCVISLSICLVKCHTISVAAFSLTWEVTKSMALYTSEFIMLLPTPEAKLSTSHALFNVSVHHKKTDRDLPFPPLNALTVVWPLYIIQTYLCACFKLHISSPALYRIIQHHVGLDHFNQADIYNELHFMKLTCCWENSEKIPDASFVLWVISKPFC